MIEQQEWQKQVLALDATSTMSRRSKQQGQAREACGNYFR